MSTPKYPDTLYVIAVPDHMPPTFDGRLEMDHLPIGGDKVRIAEYKLVRQVEVRREVVEHAEVG